MAAALFALLALAQAAPDGPVRTAPAVPTLGRPATPAPAAAAAQTGRPGAQPPTDDYGYVAWCYGALETYLGLYDRVMPEVTRIERAFPSPRGAAEDLKVYPKMRDQARKDLLVYRDAIVAAEKASPQPISAYGAVAMRRGRAVWTGTAQMKTAEIAREWMGWSPPAKCDAVAKALTVKSTVLGQALIFNAQPAPAAPSALETPPEPEAVPAPPPPVATPVAAPPPRPAPPPVTPAAAPKPAPAPAPVVQTAAPKPAAAAAKLAGPAPKPAAPAPARTVQLRPLSEGVTRTAAAPPRPVPAPAAKPAAAPVAAAPPAAPALPKGAFVMDPDSDRGCPGRLDASIRAGKLVMICMP